MTAHEPDTLHLLQAALACVSDSVEVVDLDARFVFVNAAWERMFGFSRSEALGQSVRSLRSDVHPPEFYDEAAAASGRGEPWSGELVSRRQDGSLVFARVASTPVFDPTGALAFTVVVRHDLHAALASAQEHGDRYAMAVLATRDGPGDWDLQTGEVYASDRLREIADVEGSPRELGGRLVQRVHREDIAAIGEALGTFLSGGERFFEFECRVVRGDGSVADVACRALALRDAEGVATRLVGTVSCVTQRKEAQRQLVHNATHDALTGLANRTLFVEHLQAAIGRAQRTVGPAFGLLYIDLRRFKSINDAHGHAVGDGLLQSVGRRLKLFVRPGDMVARLGGDEFAVLLDGASSAAVAHNAAQRILRHLEAPHEIDGHSLACSFTIGVALGGAASEVDQLVRAADTAMYDARRVDQQPVRVATPEAAERSKRNARLTDAFRAALGGTELSVVYQPIVDMESLRVVAVEALARWTSPEFGVVSPAEFVPLAEQSQMAGRLGQFVLGRTLADLAEWEAAALVSERFRVHVNVSPRELLDLRLPGLLSRAFASSSLQPSRLCLEITETALVEHPEVVVGNIRRIRELGVTFALEDFGTGYSSLSHLRGFAVSSVKIDRSFVMQLPGDLVSRQIVRGLLTMTEALGLEVVAEGVEGPEHVSRLRALGCRFAQGYHYARPMPPPQLMEWLAGRST
jgi:diguanylate cyclase (GGDEF)-like protein/PAS domain S-box-containing protein